MELKQGAGLSNAFIAGGVSGSLTRAILSPVDVLKIRFQLQLEPIKNVSQSKYKGVWQAVKTILVEERITAFWKGHIPAQTLSVLYGAIQFAAFESTRSIAVGLYPSLPDNPVFLSALNTYCGSLAAGGATCVCYPFDVLRTRLIGQGEPKVYRSITHAVKLMYRESGISTFYKGLVPTLTQNALYAGIQFGIYTTLMTVWKNLSTSKKNSTAPFVCGMLAGLFGKTFLLPFDMVKKRLQVIGFHEARKPFGRTQVYSGMIHCFHVVYKEEGLKAFYKGASVSVMKATLVTALSFWLYEEMIKILENARNY
ncbi:mitochondrial thiamine pyrophosphate carrier-like [Dysidea avara]|uniref:mitochondrial thiamine pyrophosphate carrier-like n=1 Tax=Dysidea avara TaxID=196820 RepID=UPI00331BC6EC